ncbi:MAG TPA: hypothetical protein VM032_16485 [Vicinamibacterales bacterium]|nr:hypothetical protein [Vicinamibacterales bacterium]
MRYFTRLLTLAALGVATASCGDVARSGRAPVFLVIDELPAPVRSDVSVTRGESGTVLLRISPKNIIPSALPSPSANNEVTITRYHVAYRRADGRNVQGVDVPYGFDGASTVTVPASGSATLGFTLVRDVAKREAPLVQLLNNPTVITTIADVTFYGQDLVGNEINATGSVQVDFGNFTPSSSQQGQ